MSVIRVLLLVWATVGTACAVFAMSSKEAKDALDATLKKTNLSLVYGLKFNSVSYSTFLM